MLFDTKVNSLVINNNVTSTLLRKNIIFDIKNPIFDIINNFFVVSCVLSRSPINCLGPLTIVKQKHIAFKLNNRVLLFLKWKSFLFY